MHSSTVRLVTVRGEMFSNRLTNPELPLPLLQLYPLEDPSRVSIFLFPRGGKDEGLCEAYSANTERRLKWQIVKTNLLSGYPKDFPWELFCIGSPGRNFPCERSRTCTRASMTTEWGGGELRQTKFLIKKITSRAAT
jgi:hypothetical protein